MQVPKQLSLFGDAPSADASDNLFLALRPSAEAAAQIIRLAAVLCSEHGLTGRPLPSERLHVTLHNVSDHAEVRRDCVAAVSQAVRDLDLRRFEVVLDRVSTFRGRRGNLPVVLRGNDGVATLAAQRRILATAMAGAGLGQRPSGSYVPHVTLLYSDRSVADRAIAPIRWHADEFVLIRSFVGQGRHVVLARWPLGS